MILIAHEMKDSLANICINRQMFWLKKRNVNWIDCEALVTRFRSIQLKGYQMKKKRCIFFFFPRIISSLSKRFSHFIQLAFNTKYSDAFIFPINESAASLFQFFVLIFCGHFSSLQTSHFRFFCFRKTNIVITMIRKLSLRFIILIQLLFFLCVRASSSRVRLYVLAFVSFVPVVHFTLI